MTRNEQHAYNEGKLARWKDEKNQGAVGSFAICPYRTADHIAAWKKGYNDQAAEYRPADGLDAEAEQRTAAFIAALQDWIARNQ